MKYEKVRSDVTVVGGGLAGVCAAVAAARLGKKVALIQNRPVLGGNSSSEVRVWVVGATGHGVNRYAREGGIMGEMFVENQYRNPEGNPYLWDLIVLETVYSEPNIQLYLNTDVHEVEADGDEDERVIHAVTGWMMGSERRIRFESPVFLDCTGDGLVGFLAGAKYRIGRESREEYGEDWAPEVADDITLGSTLLFYTKDAGHPVKYIPPSFAKDITETPIPMKRVLNSGDSGCHYWWIEWGGELDTLHDNERIRDELWAVIYGIWDYIKNSGKFDAANMTLEWVGSVPGRREYRRFIGDYVLTKHDLEKQTQFEDNVTFGGWSIDLHPPEGMYASGYTSMHYHADGIYHIPFRSLYSVNVRNLLFAGRNISASHVAFGSTRVMGTCATMGEAAGTAAAICAAKKVTPRTLCIEHMQELQQTLLWQDASVIGLRNTASDDLCLRAAVTASSYLDRIAVTEADEQFPLTSDAGLILPADSGIGTIRLLLDAEEDTTVTLELWDTGKLENYIPVNRQVRSVQAVLEGEKQWVSFELNWHPAEAQNAFLIVRENEKVNLHLSHTPHTGVLSFVREKKLNVARGMESLDQNQPVVQWNMKRVVRKLFCFELSNETKAFHPSMVIDGYKRPYGGPHMWLSQSMRDGSEPWLELQWSEAVPIQEFHLIFNDDVNEDLINLHHHRTSFEILPELVRDYRIERLEDGRWLTLFEERNNRQRKRVHALDKAVAADRIRLVITATNGSSHAEVVEIRVR